MLMKKITQVEPLDSEDSSPKEKEENSLREYILKSLFLQRLAKIKKGNSIGEIMEIFKKIHVTIPLLDAIK